MNRKNFDCPHCGQDLRLSPDAKDELELAKEEGANRERKRAKVLIEALEQIENLDNTAWHEDQVGKHEMIVKKAFNKAIEKAREALTQYQKSEEKGK